MLFALIALLFLLIAGVYLGELRGGHVIFCLLIAVAGLFLFHRFGWHLNAYTAVLGAIDVVLVLVIFKGDIRIR